MKGIAINLASHRSVNIDALNSYNSAVNEYIPEMFFIYLGIKLDQSESQSRHASNCMGLKY